jgi:hypothetical protein
MKISLKFQGGVAAGLFVFFSLVGPSAVFAATSPTLVGSASYSVLAGSAVTNTVSATTVSGDLGISPSIGVAPHFTHFPPGVVGPPGVIHDADGSAAAAQADDTAAFGFLDQACDHVYGGVQDLTLLSPLGPGVYCSTGSFILTGHLVLTGTTGVWIFKSASTLITSPGSSVTGGDPCNIWWRVASSATLDTTTHFEGNILALTAIGMNTGATLNGRAMTQTAAVTLDDNTISGPACSVPPPVPAAYKNPATVNVVKVVVNANGGTKKVSDFPLFVDGTPVASGVTNTFPAITGRYTVTETSDPNYVRTFSGDCDVNGQFNLTPGQNKFCIVTNTHIGAPVVVPPVPPLIDVVKVPSPLSLPNGPGAVTYTYTLRNVGTVPVSDVTMVGDTCSPIVLKSGDTNGDGKLDMNETWTYTCTTNLTETHTNTVVATGWANGISATSIASATVVVGAPLIPPLIHVTKIPSPLTLLAGGGAVTYTEKITNPGTVPLSNVSLNDDKCAVKYMSGDTNGDSKLDPNETWTYTCTSNLTKTTTNTAIATGEANGFTVRDIAVATVVVAAAVPALPKTGVAPAMRIPAWGVLATMIGIFAAALLLFVLRDKTTV